MNTERLITQIEVGDQIDIFFGIRTVIDIETDDGKYRLKVDDDKFTEWVAADHLVQVVAVNDE